MRWKARQAVEAERQGWVGREGLRMKPHLSAAAGRLSCAGALRREHLWGVGRGVAAGVATSAWPRRCTE